MRSYWFILQGDIRTSKSSLPLNLNSTVTDVITKVSGHAEIQHHNLESNVVAPGALSYPSRNSHTVFNCDSNEFCVDKQKTSLKGYFSTLQFYLVINLKLLKEVNGCLLQ